MSLIIRAAARTLPAGIRARYREQWLADARDATEADLRPASIALAALAFAVTLDRPLASRAVPTAEQRARRSRLAVGLALSAALLALSLFASTPGSRGAPGVPALDLVIFVGSALLAAYMVLAPITAIGLVAAQGVPRAIRWAVALFVVAAGSGIAHSFIEAGRDATTIDNLYFTPGTASYAVGLALVVLGAVLLRRSYPPARARTRSSARRRAVLAVVSAAVTLAATGLGLANLLVLRQALRATDMEFAARVVQDQPSQSDEVAAMLAHSAEVTGTAITVWAVVCAFVALGIAARVVIGSRRPMALAAAAMCLLLISHAGLLTFVWLYSFGGPGVHLTVPEQLIMLVGQWGLVAVVLYAVGGVRYSARVRHRHDVEGTVELL